MRRILFVSDSRADWYIIRPVIRAVRKTKEIEPLLLLTGANLEERGVGIIDEMEAEAEIVSRVRSAAGDPPPAAGLQASIVMEGVTKALRDIGPDGILIMGDRYEQGAAAYAAHLEGCPILHLHGGEASFGAFDESTRHMITKLAVYHFASTEEYRRRIIGMGEEPDRVFTTGAPALANMEEVPRWSREELSEALGISIPAERKLFIVTYHPVTRGGEAGATDREVSALLDLLEEIDATIILTMPNTDPEGEIVRRRVEKFALAHPDRAAAFDVLGAERYWNLMRHADLMLGNSSSGIIEAPSLGLPVVNMGARQEGRVRGANVVDVGGTRGEIISGIEKALSPEFREAASAAPNPYGDGTAPGRIADLMVSLPLSRSILKKRFYTGGHGA